jgi:hypothetical protein
MQHPKHMQQMQKRRYFPKTLGSSLARVHKEFQEGAVFSIIKAKPDKAVLQECSLKTIKIKNQTILQGVEIQEDKTTDCTAITHPFTMGNYMA